MVLLNGSGFAAPDWSVRVSLANLDDAAYEQIGDELRVVDCAGEAWRAEQAKRPSPRRKPPRGPMSARPNQREGERK